LRSDGESACDSDWRTWQERGGLMWIDLEKPDRRLMDTVAEVFGLHQVAVNVAMAERSRPKLITFDHYFILTMYGPKPLPVTSARLARETTLDRVEEIELIVGERFLLTIHDDYLPGLEEVWSDHERSETPPADMSAVVHEVMDGVVDLFFPVLDTMVDRVEEIQETAFVGQGELLDATRVRGLFSLKKQLNNLHRILNPQRNAIAVLAREELPFFRSSGAEFQDIFDHAMRQADSLAVYVDLLVSARESYLVRVSNVLANSAKMLLAVTLFFAVPMFVFTAYGMNFERIPELSLPIGHALPFLVTLVADGALFWYFQKRIGLFA
jgi:magnesium transporter